MKVKTIIILLSALVIFGCRKQSNEMDETSITLEMMEVERKDVTLERSYPAQIEGRQRVKIIPRVEGYLHDIRVKEGQHVRKGQILFVIDQSTFKAEVKASEANVEIAKANVEKAQLDYDSNNILQKNNVISEHELRMSAVALSLAKAQAAQAQAQLESARANLAYTVLRSPCNGVVGSLPFRIGDLVGPSMQEGLTTVADAQEMYVYFSFSEIEVMNHISQHGSLDKAVTAFPPVSLLLADGDTCNVKGRIESISGVVESTTGAVSARAAFSNAEGSLLSGSTGIIVLPQTMKQVLLIPKSATYEIQDRTYAWRVVNKRAESVIINVIPTNDGQHYIVTKGLSGGDVIVAKGAGYVKEGQEVDL